MHYFLADREAHARYPGSRALMLDERGFVTETTTSNVVAYRESDGLLTPRRSKILPGISLAVLAELALKLEIPLVERDLKPADLTASDEAFVTGTSTCMLPVVRVNGLPVGSGTPGEMYRKLLDAWNELVGLDVRQQAVRFATR
jgi:branched-subunit amino acid aminotransferase/4-amino-4-deoxychorismate lyase